MMSIQWWKAWISSITAITLRGSWEITLIFYKWEGKGSTSSLFPLFKEVTSIIIATWDLSVWPRCFLPKLHKWVQAARVPWCVSFPKCSPSWRRATSLPRSSISNRRRSKRRQRRSLLSMTLWSSTWKRRLVRIKIRIVSNAQRYLTLIKFSKN